MSGQQYLQRELFETRGYHMQRYSEWTKAFKDFLEVFNKIVHCAVSLAWVGTDLDDCDACDDRVVFAVSKEL